jgi:hypothetical protein
MWKTCTQRTDDREQPRAVPPSRNSSYLIGNQVFKVTQKEDLMPLEKRLKVLTILFVRGNVNS